MIVHVRNLESVIRRMTINHLIDYVQLNVTPEGISSKLFNTEKTAIAVCNLKNDVFSEQKATKEFQLNFDEPAQTVMPYLGLVDGEEAIFIINEKSVTVESGSMRSKLSLSHIQESKIFPADAPKADKKPFTIVKVDDEFRESYSKIKKIAPKFDRVYFVVQDGKLYMETTDKTNPASNGIKLEIFSCADEADKTLCFSFKNFNSVMSVLDSAGEYTISLSYVESQAMGIVAIAKADASERYYLLSIKE